jgi:DNA-directed RNA polymerase specialized sigma24 family protein
VYHLALKLTGDPAAAEDVLQETFLSAFRAIPRFEGSHS